MRSARLFRGRETLHRTARPSVAAWVRRSSARRVGNSPSGSDDRSALEVATRPSHRRFDDLVADHEHAVAWTGIAEPVRRPFRRAEAFLVINRFRPRYQDAQRL